MWLALTKGGAVNPYPAAYLVMILFGSNPITTASIDDVLLKSSTAPLNRGGNVKGPADRVRRKAPEAIARADDQELAWLAHSSALIVALLKFTAENNAKGLTAALDLLKQAGWTDTLLAISRRIDATLRSNFPPAEGELSRAATRLLRKMQQPTE
jgi:hypothetical protein